LPSEGQQRLTNSLNLFFTAIFTFESAVKMLGLGFAQFARDRFNIFDAIVAAISLIEVSLLNASSISAFRGFRLFRVVKLARTWQSLNLLLNSIAHTVATIGNFTVLLALLMYVYALLGMQFFSGKLRFDDDGRFDPNGELPRSHFDNLFWAFLTIF